MESLSSQLASAPLSRSAGERRALWTVGVLEALDASPPPEQAAAALAAAVHSTVDVYCEKRSLAALLKGVRLLAGRAELGGLFGRALISSAIGGGSAFHPRTHLGAAQLLCACCEAAEAEWAAEQGALPTEQLLPMLGLLLHATRGHSDDSTASRLGFRAVRRLLSSRNAAAGGWLAKAEEWVLAPPVAELAEAACALAAAIAPLVVHRERVRAAAPSQPPKRAKPGALAATSTPLDAAAWARALGAHLSSGQLESPSSAVKAFAPLLCSALIGVDDVMKHVLPAIVKGMKRSTEATLRCIPVLLDAFPSTAILPASAGSSLSEVLAPALTSSPVAAAAAISALRMKLDPVGATAAAMGLIGASGKGTQLGSAQRVALAEALAALAMAPPSAAVAAVLHSPHCRPAPAAGRAELEAVAWARDSSLIAEWASAAQKGCDAVCALFVPLASRETMEAPRTEMMATVGRWLGARGVGTAETAAIALTKGLTDKAADVRRAHIAAILGALTSASMAADADANVASAGSSGAASEPGKFGIGGALPGLLDPKGVGEPLLNAVKAALKKAPAGGATRADALGVISALREASSLNTALSSACFTEKIWQLALKPKDSFVWAGGAGAIGALPAGRELSLLTRCVVGVSLSSLLSSCGEGGSHALNCLVGLATHAHHPTRLAALHALHVLAEGAAEDGAVRVRAAISGEHAAACWAVGVSPRRAAAAPVVSAAALLAPIEAAVKRQARAEVEAEKATAEIPVGSVESDSPSASTLTPARMATMASWLRVALSASAARLRQSSDPELPHLLPRLLILCHHPSMLHGVGRCPPWMSFVAAWGGRDALAELLARDEAIAAHICEEILSTEGNGCSESKATRAASIGALRSLVRLPSRHLSAGEGFAPTTTAVAASVLALALPALLKQIGEAAEPLFSATPADVRVLRTETEAAAAGSDHGDRPQDESADGGRLAGGKKIGDDDVESAIRATFQRRAMEQGKVSALEKKKSAGAGPNGGKIDKAEAARQAAAAAERATCDRLRSAAAAVERRVRLLTVIIEGAPTLLSPRLTDVLPIVLPLATLPALHAAPGGVTFLIPLLEAASAAAAPSLGPLRAQVSRALLDALATGPSTEDSDAAPRFSSGSSSMAPPATAGALAADMARVAAASRLESTLPPTLEALAGAVARPLPAAGLALLLPLLHAGLDTGGPAGCAEPALDLLSMHCAPAPQAIPQEELMTMARLLLSLLSRGDRWHAPASTALLALAPSLQPESLPPLVEASISGSSAVHRLAAMRALTKAAPLAEGWHPTNPSLAAKLHMARYDPDESCASAASELWLCYEASAEAEGCAALPPSLETELLPVLGAAEERQRAQAARALASAAAEDTSRIHALLQQLISFHKESASPPKASAPPPTRGKSGCAFPPSASRSPDTDADEDGAWEARHGVALCLADLAPAVSIMQLPVIFAFLKKAFADRVESVSSAMVNAGVALIDEQPEPDKMVPLLTPMLETFLVEASTSEEDDRARMGAVVCLGALARHISCDDPKVDLILSKLVDALSTPSEIVQRTVAKSLAALLAKPEIKPRGGPILQGLLSTLLSTPSYALRRGSAFGLAGVVKGLGIATLKKDGVMAALQAAAEEKKKTEAASNAREAALLAWDSLSETLGRLFEPHVVAVLPLLLSCVADGAGGVRHAAVSAAAAIMSNLSTQGVKMVLPSLLRSLKEEDKWRAQHAAVELMGSMAFVNPKQLSATLPQLVPALTTALTHSHAKVREAAAAALESVGSVIRNPEIAEIVPALLEALKEPASATDAALSALAHCQFEHCVDPPSLSLIVPVLHRGLRAPSAQAKRRTAHITGSMCSLLADPKDIVPYMDMLLPQLQAVLMDPIPEVRSTGARALGRLCAGLGEDNFPELLTWLREGLSKDTSAVERSGAAQGLAEVLAALGEDRLAATLPELIDGAKSSSAITREGHAALWHHLPRVMGARFEPHLPAVLPTVLEGLADSSEPVREACMRAAHSVIVTYLQTSARVLLPPLQQGLSSDNYRTRQSSIELLGELLLRLTDRMPLVIVEEGEDPPEDSPLAHVPTPQQHALLASLHIARSDASAVVKAAAATTWKTLVENTPRALRAILPTLTDQLISLLSGGEGEPQAAAAAALGELVAKLGERVLPKLVPILQRGLTEGDADYRAGVCLGLAELIGAAGRDTVESFLDDLIAAVRTGLCDEEPQVYESAALAFSSLQRVVGAQAVHAIIPSMLSLLRSSDTADAEAALRGLRETVTQRPAAVVPFLIPRLVASPISTAAARALSVVASACGPSLYPLLDETLPSLLDAIYLEVELLPAEKIGEYDPECREALVSATKEIACAVDEDSLHLLYPPLLHAASPRSSPPHARAAACAILAQIASVGEGEHLSYLGECLSAFVETLDAPEPAVVRAGWSALDSTLKALAKERYLLHVSTLRDALKSVAEEARSAARKEAAAGGHDGAAANAMAYAVTLAGLRLPKALAPFSAVYLHALMTGTAEQREVAALALGEAVGLTPPDSLKPFVIQITGPLIRIVGDRFPAGVKVAILTALRLLILKSAASLKPFVPQLQTTFVKALSDASPLVRSHGASALSALAALSPRIEPLVTELCGAVANAEPSVAHAQLCALAGVVRRVPKPLSAELMDKVEAVARDRLGARDPAVASAAATLVGSCARWQPLADLLERIEESAEAMGGWEGSLAELRGHMAILRAVGPGATDADNAPPPGVPIPMGRTRAHLGSSLSLPMLRKVLPTLLGSAEAAASHERSELRQPASHALARIIAAFGEPDFEDAAEVEGGDEQQAIELAQAAALGVPRGAVQALSRLLADSSSDVRLSACHAVKKLARLRPSVMSANTGAVGGDLLTAVAAAAQVKQNTLLQSGAQRTFMHLLTACGWTAIESLPPSGGGVGRLKPEARSAAEDFLRRSYRRIRAMDSEDEHSDEDQ